MLFDDVPSRGTLFCSICSSIYVLDFDNSDKKCHCHNMFDKEGPTPFIYDEDMLERPWSSIRVGRDEIMVPPFQQGNPLIEELRAVSDPSLWPSFGNPEHGTRPKYRIQLPSGTTVIAKQSPKLKGDRVSTAKYEVNTAYRFGVDVLPQVNQQLQAEGIPGNLLVYIAGEKPLAVLRAVYAPPAAVFEWAKGFSGTDFMNDPKVTADFPSDQIETMRLLLRRSMALVREVTLKKDILILPDQPAHALVDLSRDPETDTYKMMVTFIDFEYP